MRQGGLDVGNQDLEFEFERQVVPGCHCVKKRNEIERCCEVGEFVVNI